MGKVKSVVEIGAQIAKNPQSTVMICDIGTVACLGLAAVLYATGRIINDYCKE